MSISSSFNNIGFTRVEDILSEWHIFSLQFSIYT